MATPQVKTVKKTAPAAPSNPIRKTAGKPKVAPAVLKLVTTKAANKEKTATSAPKPASMTGPLPPIVTLKHLAEWAGYNHGLPKKQAIEMLTGFVAANFRSAGVAFGLPAVFPAGLLRAAGAVFFTVST